MKFQEKTAFVAQCTKTVSAVYDHLTTLPGGAVVLAARHRRAYRGGLSQRLCKRRRHVQPRVEALIFPTAALPGSFLRRDGGAGAE